MVAVNSWEPPTQQAWEDMLNLVATLSEEGANISLDNYNLKQKVRELEAQVRTLQEEITGGP
mgnify:CR=1 FL=1